MSANSTGELPVSGFELSIENSLVGPHGRKMQGGRCRLEYMDKSLYPNWEDDGCTAWSPRSVCEITCQESSGSNPSHWSGNSRSSGAGERTDCDRRANTPADSSPNIGFTQIQSNDVPAAKLHTYGAPEYLQKSGKSRSIYSAGWSSLVARRAHNAPITHRLCRIQTT